jgi:hypothetical protein
VEEQACCCCCERNGGGDQEARAQPLQEGFLVGENRAEDGTARAPPTCRLVLNTPLAVPAWCAGTLLSRTAVTGGITNGPASPIRTISTASTQMGVVAGTAPRATSPDVITISRQ